MADVITPTGRKSVHIARTMGWSPRPYKDDNAHWGKTTEPVLFVCGNKPHSGPQFLRTERHDIFVRIETLDGKIITDSSSRHLLTLTPYDDEDLETYWHLLPNFYQERNCYHAMSAILWGATKFKLYRRYIENHAFNILMSRPSLLIALDRLVDEIIVKKELHDNIPT
jgi:hypothetical protein